MKYILIAFLIGCGSSQPVEEEENPTRQNQIFVPTLFSVTLSFNDGLDAPHALAVNLDLSATTPVGWVASNLNSASGCTHSGNVDSRGQVASEEIVCEAYGQYHFYVSSLGNPQLPSDLATTLARLTFKVKDKETGEIYKEESETFEMTKGEFRVYTNNHKPHVTYEEVKE